MVVPLEYKLYLALVTSTPGLLDAVIAITSRDHGDDTADRVWAVIQLMLAQWVGQFNVMLFMMWLLFRICKVCVWLQKRMPLRCAVALLLSCRLEGHLSVLHLTCAQVCPPPPPPPPPPNLTPEILNRKP